MIPINIEKPKLQSLDSSDSKIEIVYPKGVRILCSLSMRSEQIKILTFEIMFALTSELKFHLYNQATEMHKGFDGLSGLITNELELNPCNGDVFIFINKPRNKIKLLHWQGVVKDSRTHESKRVA